MMYNYLIYSIICFIIILYIAHVLQLKKKNNELRILQTFDPEIATITELFKEKLPIVLMDEICLWALDKEEDIENENSDDANSNKKPEKTILNKELSELGPILKDNFVHKRIIQNLDHYSLSLSRGWLLSLETVKNNMESPIIPKNEKNYMRLIGCLNGEMRVMLFPPNIDKKIVEDKELSSKLMDPKNEIPCLEIIIRVGSMIYIPFGWWYFIYSHNKTIMLDAVNTSLFGMF